MNQFVFMLSLFILASFPSNKGIPQQGNEHTQYTSSVTYRTFQPSKIKKQKRALRQRVLLWGWGILAAALLVMGSIAWLIVWLWPIMAIGWRIVALLLGAAGSSVLAFMAFFLFSYAYPTQRDIRLDADLRLLKLAEKLPFEASERWYFPDDFFRIAIAANPDGLLLVDYQNDRGLQIPKTHIRAVYDELVARDSIDAIYPASATHLNWVTSQPFETSARYPPYPASWMAQPMQVLRFSLSDLPTQQITVIYRGAYHQNSDSSRHIAAKMRVLWR